MGAHELICKHMYMYRTGIPPYILVPPNMRRRMRRRGKKYKNKKPGTVVAFEIVGTITGFVQGQRTAQSFFWSNYIYARMYPLEFFFLLCWDPGLIAIGVRGCG